MKPYDIGSAADRAAATGMELNVTDTANQVYLTFDARF
ncbi:MAG: hypothetical protein EYX74_02870 [Desulfobulbaceae bacterium]|nr:MAG: hypothetical protein EYX74_02870 [Desulfobulbaceae bacterium]